MAAVAIDLSLAPDFGIDSVPDRSYHPVMPLWHCPHCGTPQAEAARCWVCQKSSTSCATCRHFRDAVASQLGYCALDRRRDPLRGDEIRACWESAKPLPIGIGARPVETNAPPHPTIAPSRPAVTWAEVIGRGVEPREDPTPETPPPLGRTDRVTPASPSDSGLWGDLES